MKNFYETSCSDFDTFMRYQQNKENRHKKNEYKKLKSNIYGVTAIILVLAILLTTSIIAVSALMIKNEVLNDELSLQTESYREAISYYETLNAYTADNAVNDFIDELTSGVLSTDPNKFTKSKLKSFITEVENYIINFEALGLSETHPDIHQKLGEKLDEAVYALDNDTYMYPYSDKDYVLMCNLVMREQGDNVSPDESQCLVACVALNRRAQGPLYAKDAKDPENPTLLEVISQKNQYGKGYSYDMNLNGVTEKVQENVRKVFEHEYEAPYNVLFQTLKYYPDKTIYKKIWNPAPYNYYTYFYYGKTVN